MENYCLKNGRILDPATQLDAYADLRIRGGRIAEMGTELSPETGETLIDCTGCWIAPGLVDIHVHLREPGQSHKETLQTGGAAAVAGGFTSVCCMPNTDPPLDNPTLVWEIRARAERESPCKVYVVAALTQGMRGEIPCDYHALKQAGAIACSDDAFPVQSAEVMRRAMLGCAAYELPVVTHCEDKTLSEGASMHAGAVSALLGLKGAPASAETVQIARNALLAQETGCHLHIQHLSTAMGVELVRFFKAQGARISCEVAPHHLLLTDAACAEFDTDAKMNPPLRSETDRLALAQGVQQGVIDCIATDHAPHAPFEKAQPFPAAPFGIVGLETALGCVLLWNSLLAQPLTPLQIVDLLSTTPARLMRLPAGTLAVGAPADVVVIDPNLRWTVEPTRMHSKSKNTPFKGWELRGKARYTFVNGVLVHAAQ
ncbi:MAG: dihydroorotase [Armatimonadetes bacterium JP3_11]|jgi:dihydroorotase|nr:MAG: dihydroorotase [Armatimonadetes bacterium JP3_11]RMH08147.1 MAG: dihydroorotase [Armatimonadota bacterium]